MGSGLLQETSGQSLSDGGDGIEKELAAQLRDNVKGMRGVKRGESARKLASTLRVCAAHHRDKGSDAAFRKYLQNSIRRRGRDAILQMEVDQRMLQSEVRQFGLTSLPALRPVDYAEREKALAVLLAGGLTPLMTQVADTLDRVSEGLDHQPTLARVQGQLPPYSTCPDLTNQLRLLEVTLAIACLFNPVACVIITGMWTGLMISLWAAGC